MMRVVSPRGGWIEVVCGSMFSGKSEELMRRLRRAQIARQQIAVFKPLLDNRYHATDVVSHDGTRIEARPVDTSAEILRMVGDAQVVGIDEAQFFDAGVVDVAVRLADEGRRVVVAALDMDFKNEPFGPVPHLLAVAEFVDKLQAICQVCAGPATRTQRLIGGRPASPDEPVIRLGAKESYEPRCRECHELPNSRPTLDLAESAIEGALTDRASSSARNTAVPTF
ncbi:MAG: thymidine kinase [Thermoleophilia bacterium]|nr:thymidine kinase [Thermoleophilia bacterium]MCZ4496089.1 thymidine kinase [Thermoleophilia bacterium]